MNSDFFCVLYVLKIRIPQGLLQSDEDESYEEVMRADCMGLPVSRFLSPLLEARGFSSKRWGQMVGTCMHG